MDHMQFEQQAKSYTEKLSNKILIDGELTGSTSSSQSFSVINPANLEIIGHCLECGELDVEQAVTSSYNAFQSWSKIAVRERGEFLLKIVELLQQHKEEMAKILCLEISKPFFSEALGEINSFIDILKFYSGLGSEIKGEVIPLDPKMLTYTVRQPLGVIAAILPWNAPLMLMSLKIAPALLAGNCVVVKPSEYASFSVLKAIELINTILPKGVLNLVTGHAYTGNALIKHPKVKKVSFTGSVATGRKIYATAAEKLIPVNLELGGKSPMIVCADSNIDQATDGAISGMRFSRQGQSCTASSRIFLHEKIYDQFLSLLMTKLDKMVIGNPFLPDTSIGAVICQAQFDRIKNYIELGSKTPGVKKLIASRLPSEAPYSQGYFLQPTIFTDIDHNHQLVQEEIFGPVTTVFRWNDLNQVLQLANDSCYGLAATFWSNDLKASMLACDTLDAGLVQINQNLVVKANLPFGGFKDSGLGQEATMETMLEQYSKRKTIIINKG